MCTWQGEDRNPIKISPWPIACIKMSTLPPLPCMSFLHFISQSLVPLSLLIAACNLQTYTINFLYNSCHVALWCLEVVPVVYARVFTYARAISSKKFIKWCNMHAQLTTWVARCDESKHDEVAFQPAAANFGSNYLWQTSYLKDNSWMSILHQYHKANGLKACTTMCRSEKWKWGNIFKMADKRSVVHVSSFLLVVYCSLGRGGGIAVVKEYEIITLKYIGKACRLYFDLTRQHEVWRKILLQADPIEMLTACVLVANTKQNSTIQRIRLNWTRKWPKWNEIARGEYDYDCIRKTRLDDYRKNERFWDLWSIFGAKGGGSNTLKVTSYIIYMTNRFIVTF